MNPVKHREASHHCRLIRSGDPSEKARNLIRRTALGIFFLPALRLLAQQAPPTVMAGTKLRVQFDNEVGTAISRVGDGVEVHLLKPLEGGGREVLPVGTILTGRVIAVRKGNKKAKSFPMIRLGLEQLRLPDGRSFPVKASLTDLGKSEHVDSEGAASTVQPTKGENVGVAATSAGIGAGAGAIAGGSKGAGVGAGVGAAVGILSDLAANAAQWDDFVLKQGRKAWLRLDSDLTFPPSPSPVRQTSEAEGPSAPAPLPQGRATAPVNSAPTKRASDGLVYVEPAPQARFYRVNTKTLLRDLNKAGIPLTVDSSQADYVLHTSCDAHGFQAYLTSRDGYIAWVGSAHTQGGVTRALLRYMHDRTAGKSKL